MFYTDVDIFRNKILVRGYEYGKRIQKEIEYRPYLFVPSKTPTEYRNVNNEYVARMDFESIFEAKEFTRKYKDISNFKIYGMDRFVYPFISDNYPGTVNYDANMIRVMYLDIEVDSEDGFPDIALANREINAITYRIGTQRTVLGLKKFDKNKLERISDPDNIHYYQFKSEEDMLRSFLKLWENSDVDVVTGWNIEFFDIPYIVRRLRIVLGDEEAKRISPWRRLQERNIEIRGKEHQVFYPTGIAILDYQQLYKKFTYSQRESYSLNYISHVELGVEKMDYSQYENLADLYNKNHQLFIEYNIIDVDLVYQLEDKLRLIELVWAIAYDAKVNYTDALGSVLLWDVLIMNYLMEKKIVVNPSKKKAFREFEGAYVKEPIPGMYDWVVSFDLTSLYPHLIMQYNISPETFEGKDPHWTEHYSIQNLIEEPVDFHKQQIYGQEDKGLSRKDTHAVAANGCYYSKERLGFLPALMDLQFKLRAQYKDKMMENKKMLQAVKAELAKRNK